MARHHDGQKPRECPPQVFMRFDQRRLFARMGGGGGYVRTTDTFEIPRISYEEWQASR